MHRLRDVLGGLLLLSLLVLSHPMDITSANTTTDTGQSHCYDEYGYQILCPEPGEPLFGQDANYHTPRPDYVDNGDGTITDTATGLMWQQTPAEKMTWDDALNTAPNLILGGYNDWRVPTVKELYSLINFNGIAGKSVLESVPYIDIHHFGFFYGNESRGEHFLAAQYWSSTEYTSTTMGDQHTVFGVNFASGRITGYGTLDPTSGQPMRAFVRFVRGQVGYGFNDFVDHGDGTITDRSTGLIWSQNDSGLPLNWVQALGYCESLSFAGYDDWRLPDAKELQSLVDYRYSPDATQSATIDPLFRVTAITDENGGADFPYYWTSTSHLYGAMNRAVYIAFGEALGETIIGDAQNPQIIDTHGAGSQRSDIKVGDADFISPPDPTEHEETYRIRNFARCVRGGEYMVMIGGVIDDDWNVRVASLHNPVATQQAVTPVNSVAEEAPNTALANNPTNNGNTDTTGQNNNNVANSNSDDGATNDSNTNNNGGGGNDNNNDNNGRGGNNNNNNDPPPPPPNDNGGNGDGNGDGNGNGRGNRPPRR